MNASKYDIEYAIEAFQRMKLDIEGYHFIRIHKIKNETYYCCEGGDDTETLQDLADQLNRSGFKTTIATQKEGNGWEEQFLFVGPPNTEGRQTQKLLKNNTDQALATIDPQIPAYRKIYNEYNKFLIALKEIKPKTNP